MKTKHIVFIVIAIMIFTLLGVTKVNAENGPSDQGAYIELWNMKEPHSIYKAEKIYNNEIEGATYNLDTNTLTLSNVNVPELGLALNKMGDDFKIKLVGENNIGEIAVYGDNYGGSLTITGDGILNIDTGNNNNIPHMNLEVDGIYLYAENSDAKLTIENTATVNIKSVNNAIRIINTPNSNKNNAIILKNGQDISSDLMQKENTVIKYEEANILEFSASSSKTYQIYEKDGKMYGIIEKDSQGFIRISQILYDSNLNKYFFDPTYTTSVSSPNNMKYNTEEDILKDGYVATTKEVTIDCYAYKLPNHLSQDSEGNKYFAYRATYSGEEYVYDISDFKITLSDGKEYSTLIENNDVKLDSLEEIKYQIKNGNYDYIVPLKTLNIVAGEPVQENNEEEQKQEDTNPAENVKVKVENAENNEEDIAAKKEVEKLVESIISKDTGTVDGIDEKLANKIRQKVENGETIFVEVVTEEVKAEDVEQDVKKVEEKISGSNKKIAALFNIDILVKTAKEELGSVTKLKNKITLALPIPKNLPDVPEGYTRIYKVIRVHNGVAEELETTVSGKNILFESDEFSTYVLTYEDIKDTKVVAETTNTNVINTPVTGDVKDTNIVATETKANATNTPATGDIKDTNIVATETKTNATNTPATGDNIVLYITVFTITTIGLALTLKIFIK